MQVKTDSVIIQHPHAPYSIFTHVWQNSSYQVFVIGGKTANVITKNANIRPILSSIPNLHTYVGLNSFWPLDPNSCLWLQVWQHCDCMRLETEVEHYLCELCDPRPIDRVGVSICLCCIDRKFLYRAVSFINT